MFYSNIASYYDKVALAYQEYALDTGVSEHIDSFLSLLPPQGKILDIGCGVGIDDEYMIEKSFQVSGIDVSDKMLAYSQLNCPDGKFFKQDIADNNLLSNFHEAGSFDGIWAAYSLIHLQKSQLDLAFNNIYQLLKPRGILSIWLQAGRSQEGVSEDNFAEKNQFLLSTYTQAELTNRLTENGQFVIISSFTRPPIESRELSYDKLGYILRKI